MDQFNVEGNTAQKLEFYLDPFCTASDNMIRRRHEEIPASDAENNARTEVLLPCDFHNQLFG